MIKQSDSNVIDIFRLVEAIPNIGRTYSQQVSSQHCFKRDRHVKMNTEEIQQSRDSNEHVQAMQFQHTKNVYEYRGNTTL